MSSKTAQQFAALMMQLYEDRKVPRIQGESDPEYFRRIRKLAVRVQHEQRKAKRKTARASRKANR